MCGLSVEALKRDGVKKRSNASMDKSFDGMQEKYDFDSIRCSFKKTISISISMIVTSVLTTESDQQNTADVIYCTLVKQSKQFSKCLHLHILSVVKAAIDTRMLWLSTDGDWRG